MKDIPEAELKRFPVEQVSWDDAQLFLRELNKHDEEEGWVYRLPKEVEWEYACRGGPMANNLDSAFDFYFDRPVAQLQADQANFQLQGPKRTCKVGSYKPNRLGLYDMHGNVWEWCDDLYDPKDPSAPRSGCPGAAAGTTTPTIAGRRTRYAIRAGPPEPRPGPAPGPSSRWLSGQVREGRPRPAQPDGWSQSERSEGGSRRAGAGCGRGGGVGAAGPGEATEPRQARNKTSLDLTPRRSS